MNEWAILDVKYSKHFYRASDLWPSSWHWHALSPIVALERGPPPSLSSSLGLTHKTHIREDGAVVSLSLSLSSACAVSMEKKGETNNDTVQWQWERMLSRSVGLYPEYDVGGWCCCCCCCCSFCTNSSSLLAPL